MEATPVYFIPFEINADTGGKLVQSAPRLFYTFVRETKRLQQTHKVVD